jgi:hypothetical protein
VASQQREVPYLSQLCHAASATNSNAAAVVMQRAAQGQLPAGAVSGIVTARVTVVSVAPDGTSVTFTGPSGVFHTAEVSPQMQSFVERLRPGDQVDVGFANELAVSVQPMQ